MTNSRTRRLALAAMAAAAVGMLLTNASTVGAQTGDETRTGANYRLGEVAGGRGRDIPALAVNPADGRHLVEVEHDILAGNCRHNVSFDAGATWSGGVIANAPGFPAPDSPVTNPACAQMESSLEWGSGQNVYTTYHARRNESFGSAALIARSTDGGRTFPSSFVAMDSTGASPSYNQARIAVVPGGGTSGADRIYMAALRAGAPGPRVVVSVSNDSGATWSAPVDVTGNVNSREPSEPVVGPDGTVYVAWRTATFEGAIWISRSTNAGVTWTKSQVVAVRGYQDETGTQYPPSGGRTNNNSRLAIDPNNGNLYLVYMQGPPYTARQDHFIHPDVDVLFVRSTTGGTTWSNPPVRLNDDPLGTGAPSTGVAQRLPNVAVAPNGRVDVVWQDRRHGYRSPTHSHLGNGEARFGDTYYDFSTDAGVTWNRDRRISDKSQNLDIGYDHYGQVYWSWGPALVHLGNDEILFAWQDSREGNYHNENEDIYLARLNRRSPATIPVQRIPDNTRPAVSADVSRWAYSGGLEAVLNVGFTNRPVTRPVIVNEGDHAAALVGSVLSRAHLAPVLATPASRLTPEVRTEVARLEPVGAFVIGGEGAVGPGVVNDLADAGVPRGEITRLAGSSPADTARLVALSMDRRSDEQRSAGVPAFDAAVVVNPASLDAGAAAGLAAHRRLPILFVTSDSVPEATSDALRALNITTTLVVGGPSAIGDAVVGAVPGGRRVGGADAYATSRAVAQESVSRLVPSNIVYVADGAQPFDAALAGAAAARTGALVLLSPGADTTVAAQSLEAVGLRAGVDRLIVVRSFASLGGPGYRLVASDGGVFAFGGVPFLGSTGAIRLNQPMVAMADTPGNLGYWLAASDGGVFAFGDAPFRGSMGAIRLNQPVVGMAATPSGDGYWLVASDGGVFAFGDARFFGSLGGILLNKPVVGMAATPSGRGYWLVASDGGVFAFGDAAFRGSTGGVSLNKPMVAMAASPSGRGYWLVASDGGVFAFGDADFFGSTGAIRLNEPVVGADSTPSGKGYHLVASDGGVFAFGDAVFSGSTGGIRLNRPVVGMAAAN